MRKSKLLIIFAVFMFLGFVANIQANEIKKCEYKSDTEDITVTFNIRITGAETASFSGKDNPDNWFGESVLNWSSSYPGSSFTGQKYYETNNQCPPYALIFKKTAQGINSIDLYISDSNNIAIIEKIYKQSNTVVGGFPKLLKLKNQKKSVSIYNPPSSCLDFSKEGNKNVTANNPTKYYSCENNPYFSCIWNETKYGGYCNVNNLTYVKCGSAYDIPSQVPKIVSFVVNLLKIATPIILILVSIITLLKALAASKEDEIKKAQSSLIKKLIAAALVFFIISIVQFVISKVADSTEQGDLRSCLTCLLNNDCGHASYYKTDIGGISICTYINGEELDCENGSTDKNDNNKKDAESVIEDKQTLNEIIEHQE